MGKRLAGTATNGSRNQGELMEKHARYLTKRTLIYLVTCRKIYRLKQAEVAELFNVTRGIIVGFESGRNERVDVFLKYVYNFVPESERQGIIDEYVKNALK